jgi:hypothetical protein
MSIISRAFLLFSLACILTPSPLPLHLTLTMTISIKERGYNEVMIYPSSSPPHLNPLPRGERGEKG